MSMTYLVSCDNPGCGEVLRYRDTEEKDLDGWLEVWQNEDSSLDFCGKNCMIEYFNPSEEDDE